jgi:three-Cys-motif partner protein
MKARRTPAAKDVIASYRKFRFIFAEPWGRMIAGNDGLPTIEVRPWAEDKYAMVGLYDRLFSTAMKKKWDTRVYIDLYSGPGFVHVAGTNRFLWGSPLIAMEVSDPFDKYIFCEKDPTHLDALRTRARRLFPRLDAHFVAGDCNEQIDQICAAIPRTSKQKRVLSFCFLDPFDISIKFSTVRRLADFRMDFLFLLALHMDANRNLTSYLSRDNSKIDDFLGLPDWRERWRQEEAGGKRFPRFLAEEYSRLMETLGYLPVPFHRMKQIRSDEKNLPLYHLALFSRHNLAYDFWGQVLQYSSPQRKLFSS